jgi:conjugal transfer pilus assembly protein TraV
MNAPSSLRRYLIPVVLLALTGCTSLSGVGGSTSLSCPVPSGSTCKPIGQVYQSSPQSGAKPTGATVTPAQTLAMNGEAAAASQLILPVAPALTPYVPAMQATRTVPTTGEPIRSQTRTLKIWIAPWEDEEGALSDHGYLYVMIDSGRWQIEHSRARILREFGPTRAPKAASANQGSGAPSHGNAPGPSVPDATRQQNLPSLPQLLGMPAAGETPQPEATK